MTLKAIVLPSSQQGAFMLGIVIRHFFGTGDIYVNHFKKEGAGN